MCKSRAGQSAGGERGRGRPRWAKKGSPAGIALGLTSLARGRIRDEYGVRVAELERRALDEREFEECVEEALDSLPPELAGLMSNVAVVVEEEPPAGAPLLGLYQGVPLTRRGSGYAGVPPDKITIFRRPLERLHGADRARLRHEIRRVVLHEVAHHFGISDERLVELDRY
jgi:predicted Zn-dependent protease with MMP-like domain